MARSLESDAPEKSTTETPKIKITSEMTRLEKIALLKAKQNKAYDKLDKMVEDISSNDLPGMCSFNFSRPPKPPTSSKSDGRICTDNPCWYLFPAFYGYYTFY